MNADNARIPRRRKKKSNVVFNIVLIVLIGVFLYAAYNIFTILTEYSTGDNEYAALEQHLTSTPPDDASPEQPGRNDHTVFHVDFDALRKVNPDVIGWIISEGTRLNYPVVQGTDNWYYTSYTYKNVRNRNGSIFMDSGNSPVFSDENSVLYGHNMKSGAMFAEIVKYRDQDYYDAHKRIYLITPEGQFLLEIASVFLVHSGDPYTTRSFETAEQMQAFLDSYQEKSLIETDLTLTSADRIITLSTCEYDFQNARLAVQGRLVPMQSPGL